MSTLPARLVRWDAILVGAWAVMIAVTRAAYFEETDPYWQVRDGLELLDGRTLAAPDSWSWAPVEGLYYPNSPAWNVLLGLAWRWGGFPGFVAFTAVVITAYLAVAVWVSTLAGARRIPTLVALLVVASLAWPGIGARATMPAQILVLLAIGLGYVVARRCAQRAIAFGLAWLFGLGLLLSVAGNWMHVSWATWAAAVAVAWLVMWLFMPELTRGTALGYSLAGSAGLFAGVAFGPYGLNVFGRSSVVFEASRGLITEWSPAWHPEQWTRWLLPAVLAVLVAVLAAFYVLRVVKRGRRTTGLPIMAALLVIAFPAALAGLLAIRFAVVAWLTLLPVCAVGLNLAMDRLHRVALIKGEAGPWGRVAEWTSDGFWRIILGACAIVLLPFAVFASSPMGRPDVGYATELLPQGCRLFSRPADAAGVLLIRPDVLVWIDGRADYWGRDRIQAYGTYVAALDPDHPVPPGSDCVLLPDPLLSEAFSALGRLLDANQGWVRVGGGDGYVVWVQP